MFRSRIIATIISIKIGIIISILTPSIWQLCWEGCSYDYIHNLLQLFYAPPLGDFMWGIFAPLNWIQFFGKILIVLTAIYVGRNYIKNGYARLFFYATVLLMLFLVPRLMYVYLTEEGRDERISNVISTIYTVGRDIDEINADLERLENKLGSNYGPLDYHMRTGIFQGVFGYIAKFDRCYWHHFLVCFDARGRLVYKEGESVLLKKHVEDMQRIARQYGYCDDLFTQSTCVLDPQRYTSTLNMQNIEFTKDWQIQSLYHLYGIDSEYKEISIFTPTGEEVCTVRQENFPVVYGVVGLTNCIILPGKTYIILITLEDNKILPVMRRA